MAKRLKEVEIVRYPDCFFVYVDKKYDSDIIKIEGVATGYRIDSSAYIHVHIDPRYSADELEQEIIECCR